MKVIKETIFNGKQPEYKQVFSGSFNDCVNYMVRVSIQLRKDSTVSELRTGINNVSAMFENDAVIRYYISE